MEKIKLLLMLCVVAVCLAACGKKNTPTPIIPPPVDTTPVIIPPLPAILLTPGNNEPCTTGTSVSATKSTVTFTWLQAEATDLYEVHFHNLLTGDSVVTSTASLTVDADLLKGTPYSWFIISKEKKTTKVAQSDTWKFYNSGPGITVYPPYPAEIISPAMSQSVPNVGGTITLKWKGTAGSNTIKNYDVYFGGDPSPPLTNANVTTTQETYNPGGPGTYYWKIVTRDNAGNTSTTQVYSFYLE